MPLGDNLKFEKKTLMRKTGPSKSEPESVEPVEALTPQVEKTTPPPAEMEPAAEPAAVAPQEKARPRLASTSFLIFQLHAMRYALDANAVREIFRLPELTPIEEAPEYVAGVVNLRGKIVPVVNLDLRLGRESDRYQLSQSVVVVELAEDFLAGVIVDEVQDVSTITEKSVEVALFSSKRRDRSTQLISFEAKLGEDIIMIINQLRLFTSDALDDLMEGEAGDFETTIDNRRKRLVFCPEASEAERETFRERARSLMVSVEGQDYTGLMPLSVIGLNNEYFGIDLEVVREFANIKDVTPIPCCPDHIVGNMNLRGDILTIIDIRQALKMPINVNTEQAKVIVVQSDGLQVGIYVDDVYDVIYMNSADIARVPAAVHSVSDEYLKGTAPFNDRVLSVLDLQKILERGELIVEEEV